ELGGLAVVTGVYAVMALAGLGWGLPSRDVDQRLFGDGEPWAGERIARLAGASDRFGGDRGADVDVDPLHVDDGPTLLNGTPEQAGAIYLRYRLYTHQPDEMITIMALAGMQPGSFDFDPRLYQYGGLFIYPVGALIRVCGLTGLIEVRSDLTYYLDHPGQMGRFYMVARAYVACWGLIGVLAVWSIGRRLGGGMTGLLAAAWFALLPVVVCMSHEAKPHLPGAVLMLLAVLAAMRYVDTGRAVDRWWFAAACGAALGMVLSSLPILILIPLVELIRMRTQAGRLAQAIRRTTGGVAAAVAVYLLTNPYVPINLVANPAVLRSNLSNSTAMYEIDRIGEGLARMLSLTLEGATLPILLIGVLAVVGLIQKKRSEATVLLVPAGLFFVQFVLLGAGKPAEYGRFGLFVDIVLAVVTAWALTRYRPGTGPLLRGAAVAGVTFWVGLFGARYLDNFLADTTGDGSRFASACVLADGDGPLAVLAEPAPYSCPPVDFARREVWLFPSVDAWRRYCREQSASGRTGVPNLLVAMRDRLDAPASQREHPVWHSLIPYGSEGLAPAPPATPISWANKPVGCLRASDLLTPQTDD
ncbi:MAG: hypothetical protein GY778_01785, partial [bacterium]|nr:hypothetical protein [bacterium]